MFRELAGAPRELDGRRDLLDGEVVALQPDGSQDFHALTWARDALGFASPSWRLTSYM